MLKLTLEFIWLNLYERVLNQNCIWLETQLFLMSLNCYFDPREPMIDYVPTNYLLSLTPTQDGKPLYLKHPQMQQKQRLLFWVKFLTVSHIFPLL